MISKKRYYLIGFLLLIGAIVGYHFYAASQAEQQIDEAIQKQTEKISSISAQYSSIKVAPFEGSVLIRDLTVILGDHIERAQHFQLNLSYLDFLNIYIGGLEYGLDHLQKATITIFNPSYVNRAGLEELKSDKLTISYEGNALDGLTSAINGTNFTSPQSIEAESSRLIIQLPKTTLSKVQATKFRYSGTVSGGQQNFWTEGSHQFSMDSLTWTPSKAFQDSYSFFIKGFGYPTDAIPFQTAQLHFKPAKQKNSEKVRIESAVRSELALFSSSGFILLKDPLRNSELENLNISITKFSESFSRVLTNIERLLSVSLPRTDEGINLQLKGTLSNPVISPQ